MSTANVRSIDSVKAAREAILGFIDEARVALGAADMEINRAVNWLTNDQRLYWTAQLKRRNEQLSMARTELARRRLSQANSESMSDSDQKEAVHVAQRRVRDAELKLETVKRWIPILQHAVSEYRGHGRSLADSLDGELQRSLALLERMVAALEGYTAIAPPPAPSSPGAGESP